MTDQKPKLGKKGGAKEVAKKLSEIRKQPISNEMLRIVDESDQIRKQLDKKIAKSKTEVEL